jgi:glycerol kinase
MSILVIDVGTSGLRASVVNERGAIEHLRYEAFAPHSPTPGMVEFDAQLMRDAVLRVSTSALQSAGTVNAVGITNQRASTIMWDRTTGVPCGPALGWQDLRTVMECIMARSEHNMSLAPNQTATKAAWMIKNYPHNQNICFGTVDTWVAFVLSKGELHVTDHSNAAVTGLYDPNNHQWSSRALGAMGVDVAMMPRIVNSSGVVGVASALPGSPPIASLVGDQQGSLIGQGCIVEGTTKITFGTGGMLDTFTGNAAPTSANRLAGGTFPIIAYSDANGIHWGNEAIMLSAGTNIDWLCTDMQLIDSPEQSHDVASQVETSDGVVYVPALLGLGTPKWDYGARGTLLGITRGTNRSHIVRAVLEGIAHRGADMVDASQSDSGLSIDRIRIDGGMSKNPTFVQALANATQRTVEVSPVTEATTLGAAFLAGVAVGTWKTLPDAVSTWKPSQQVAPNAVLNRDQWASALSRAGGWIPELSGLDF